MTPRLRTHCPAGLLLLAGLLLSPGWALLTPAWHQSPPSPGPPSAVRAHGYTQVPEPSPSRAVPAPEESRAGSRAGEGRPRPGRADPPPPDDTAESIGTASGSASSGTDPPSQGVRPQGSAAQQRPPDPPVHRDEAVGPTSTPTGTPEATPDPAGQAAGPTGPVMGVLPLGTGLVLVGLGLAFLALRLRRD
ncbi:hypothetical protein ACWD4J_17620 [Streptomyces sp. NPDC002577]